jgi:hypothetical protein
MFGISQVHGLKQMWRSTGVVGSGLEVVLSSRRIIYLGLLLGFLLAIFKLVTTTPLYTARMVIGPAQIDSGSSS